MLGIKRAAAEHMPDFKKNLDPLASKRLCKKIGEEKEEGLDGENSLSKSKGLYKAPIEKKEKVEWTAEEMRNLFLLYKQYGTRWVTISKHLPGHTDSDAKNKFYTTLKRVATQAHLEDPIRFSGRNSKCKRNLVQFVDIAMNYSHLVPSKKGRKSHTERLMARTQGLLFPKASPLPQPSQQLFQNLCLVPAPIPYVMIPFYQPGTPFVESGIGSWMISQGWTNNYNG